MRRDLDDLALLAYFAVVLALMVAGVIVTLVAE